MVTKERLLTVDEFWQVYAGKPYELIHGEVIEVSPAGGDSPIIAALITALLTPYILENKLGLLTNAEGGYYLEEDILVAPDFAFYSWEKHKLHVERDKYRPFAPDLAVEVVSPSDKSEAVDQKIKLYLENGVRLVWVIYPLTRTVMVFRPDAHPDRLSEKDTLSGEDVLPDLEITIADIFPPQPPE